MKSKQGISRRNFLQMGASLGMVASLGSFKLANATQAADYKALVCVFMFGGNDGHNVVVPWPKLSDGVTPNPEYTTYSNGRGALALAQNKLLPINAGTKSYGLNYGLPELQSLYQQGRMAVLANVGMIVQPTSRQQYLAQSVPLPSQLFSHSDQIIQVQTGAPNTSTGTGWGGRTVDLMASNNAGTNFPVAISLNGSALFNTTQTAKSASFQPGNYLDQNAMSMYPASAGTARMIAQQEINALNSGLPMITAANQVMTDAVQLNPLLKGTAGGQNILSPFPNTSIGNQLKEVAHLISLRSQLAIGRQVFFVGLGGFDTHSSEAYDQWALLVQVSQAMSAFYNATLELGIANQVTTFTLSEFGRTLQPNNSGSDHGWGSHHLVVGGAVNGGNVYGTFPSLILGGNDDANNRGVLIPTTSLSQYGATLARWFGATDSQLNAVFPTLVNFPLRDLGFMA